MSAELDIRKFTLAVARIDVEFLDEIGNVKNIIGSGFWIKIKEKIIFITNKHNVDSQLCFKKEMTINSLAVLLRSKENSLLAKSFIVKDFTIKMSLMADVAIIYDIGNVLDKEAENYVCEPILLEYDRIEESFANQEFFKKLQPLDAISFIGYAAFSGVKLWDTEREIPLARTGHISSWPDLPFNHTDLQTKDVTIVSGLSFSGASGSMVISYSKGLKLGPGLKGPEYIPPRIVGIMSGHWWDDKTTPGFFRHSGLSYYTRSTTIIELIRDALGVE